MQNPTVDIAAPYVALVTRSSSQWLLCIDNFAETLSENILLSIFEKVTFNWCKDNLFLEDTWMLQEVKSVSLTTFEYKIW